MNVVESTNSNIRLASHFMGSYAQYFPINFVCQTTHSFHQINVGNRDSHTLGSCVRNVKPKYIGRTHLQMTIQHI